jgi:hypothetical protein
MRRYYRDVPENYMFRTEATGHIVVVLEMHAPGAFPYFVAFISLAVLETETRRDKIYSK